MATFYLDTENGSDAAAGTSFATRRKTITGLTSTQGLAAGDTVRVMGSPDPTLVGNATWTQYSKTITLASAVTANISDCQTLWTASTNVTCTANTSTFKENTASMRAVIATAFTTGKVCYFPTGTLDLSAYQQVSFWVYNETAIAASTLSLRLCTDTLGATSVHTIAIPAITSTSQWVPVTVDLGGALNAAIASVALYQDVDIAALNIQLDNILACKASAAADSLSLTSLIGKVCNLSWIASTAYATGDERKPTQPNRNGFRYKATTGGTTGSTEPTWPLEIGVTVTDGTVVWNCVGLEDTWYGIQSINGTTVRIDNHVNCLGNAGRGYAGATETVPTYKRDTIKFTMAAATTTSIQAFQVSGSNGNPITYSGGWNRTDMSTQTGETWLDGQNGLGRAIDFNFKAYLALTNLNVVRTNVGLYELGNSWVVKSCHFNNITNGNINSSGQDTLRAQLIGVIANNGGAAGFIHSNGSGTNTFLRCAMESNLGTNFSVTATGRYLVSPNALWLRNGGTYGFASTSVSPMVSYGLVTGNNATAGVNLSGGPGHTLVNSLIPETSAVVVPVANSNDTYYFLQRHQQTADNHAILAEGGSIVSATDQRHTASGIAWKFQPTSTVRTSFYPLKLSVAKIACAAGTAVTVSIWVRRDNTNIQGQLFLAGGQIAGVPADVTTACAPTINTWVQYSLSFTPTETGAVEVYMKCWDGIGASASLWIDDISVA